MQGDLAGLIIDGELVSSGFDCEAGFHYRISGFG
jgi:hypothetical protein